MTKLKAKAKPGDELIFVPLGGAGEIGMNLNLYGYGPENKRQWIMVDLGVMFGGDDTPGIDVILPDPAFIEEHRRNLLGIVLTHAHEDHIGAVGHLWSRFKVPVYATPFTAALVRGKLEEADILEEVPLHVVPLGGALKLGPFELEFIDITHSIPEPNCIVIRTPLGNVMHTGDWKIDPTPVVGRKTDIAALKRVGDEGILATVCDSTNVFVPGRSGSEADVAKNLERIIASRQGRIAVSAFASNVARMKSVIKAATAAKRHVALVGRSMHKIANAAIETGYLKDIPSLIDEESATDLPAHRVLYLCTGSQGEPRAALTRIAAGDHPHVTLGRGDSVIFSSRMIPGNERLIHEMQNSFATRGVEVISAEDDDVHVSGHPARDELSDMYGWLRPQIAVPVHGEERHLREHVRLAKSLQVPEAIHAPNGSVVRLAPGPATIVDEAPHGRLHLDGSLVVTGHDAAMKERRSVAFAGAVMVTIVLDGRNRPQADPTVQCVGLPEEVAERARQAAHDALDTIRRSDDDARMAEDIRRMVRRDIHDFWRKKPLVKVEVVRT